MKMFKPLMPLALAWLLVACNAVDRSIPRFDDADGAAKAMLSLSPWEDGSPDRSNDGRTPGEQGSDRQTFFRWFQRYMQHELGNQHRRDYTPFPVPATIAQAIAEQRAFEADRKKKADAAQAQRDEEQAVIDDDAAYYEQEAAREQAAKDAAAEQATVKQAEQDAALATEQQAAKDAEYQMQLSEAKQSRSNYECRRKRQEAASASLSDKSGTLEPGAYQRIWNSFPCRSDKQHRH